MYQFSNSNKKRYVPKCNELVRFILKKPNQSPKKHVWLNIKSEKKTIQQYQFLKMLYKTVYAKVMPRNYANSY